MNNLTEKDIKSLFAGLCCSQCKNEFTTDCFKLIEKDCGLGHYSLTCAKCGKDFGEILLNIDKKADIHSPFEVIDGPEPISIDDVINAHNFYKNL